MATSKEFHDYVMEQLAQAGEITSRKMMGEYCVYYKDKTVALICDDQLFLKPTPTVLEKMPDADRGYPYEGSKTLMVIADNPEDRELMKELFAAMYDELPATKKKR